MFKSCIILVADGARADTAAELLSSGQLPRIKEHITDRGCFRRALTVFPSTTGPAHIPFVCGIHPGTANVPGYRWLSRQAHDSRRRSFARHRSLNTPRGLFLGRDMDPDTTTSLYEYFENPAGVLEPVDYCPSQGLYKVIARRLFYVIRAHHTDNWGPVDRMVERVILRKIRAGSECIIATFFGIDEYSHLHHPTHPKTLEAYRNIDTAVGNIAAELKARGRYDETIMALVSDHGLSGTTAHIPLVDILKEHGFRPFHYPRLYRRDCDSAVMESGNSMAQLYFKRDHRWGANWTYEELSENERLGGLLKALVRRDGMSFAVARLSGGGLVFVGRRGNLRAVPGDGGFEISIEGTSPLPNHPIGRFSRETLFERTFDATYPDAVNQAALLLNSERSGDLLLSSEPGYDLRLQFEDPEHHGSHGSLHREHMHVPLALSVPIEDEFVGNCDLVPTILALTGKRPTRSFDGKLLRVDNGAGPPVSLKPVAAPSPEASAKGKGNWISIAVTAAIILFGMVITAVFKEDIFQFGQTVMARYGQEKVDIILFLLTAVSSTPLALPIWGYALVGVAMGYHVLRLAMVMALGSATGSTVTFLLGRYFGGREWVKRKFPNLQKHPWAHGRSRAMVTLILFIGTASPIPCDVFYAACGLKRYPTVPFWITMVAGRFVRYCYLGYGFDVFKEFL